jgi:biopolymer transport protein ExbB/TolQ
MNSLVDAALGMALAASSSSAGGGELNGIQGFSKNIGIFGYINLFVSAVVLTVIIERALFQSTRYSVNAHEAFVQVKKYVQANNVERAIKMCEGRGGAYPLLQLIRTGLLAAGRTADEIDATMSEKLAELKPAVERWIGALWSLANIATLIGLLGTVSGLIHTFGSISGISDPAQRQSELSKGISEAMTNTAFGLGIAVSCMIAHLILSTRSKKILHDLDSTQEKLFNLLTVARGH